MTTIHDLARTNDVESIRQFLNSNPDAVNQLDVSGQIPLHRAAWNNKKDTAELLLASGAIIDLQDKNGHTPLYTAANNNSKETVELLLTSGANVDLQENGGWTPLYVAACKNHKETVQILLASGANPDIQNEDGKTPLKIAKGRGHIEIVTLLENFQQKDVSLSLSNSNENNKDDSTAIDIKAKIQNACQIKTRKWNRSKIMIVGEGRAGKTALANSIIGSGFKETDSTIGINNLTCSVNYADVSNGNWDHYEKPEKELEAAIAMSIREQQSKQINADNQNNSIVTKDVAQYSNMSDAATTHYGSHPSTKLSTPSVVVPKPNIAVPKPGEIDNDFVAKCLAENIQTSSDLIISLFDFGGQSVFDVIHHLFLTPYGVYIVVFNLSWLTEGASEADKVSCWSRLEVWVNSIFMHTSENSSGTGKKGYKCNTTTQSAPIVFVGTCKDKLTETVPDIISFMQGISNKIRSKVDINSTPIIRNAKEELWFFPVNNVLGRADSSLINMLQSIEDVIKKSDYVIQEKPLIWLQALDKLKTRKDVTSYSMIEVSQVLESCGIKEHEYLEVLSFFNKMGELLWINEDSLRDTIIMDPISFFVTPATRVICKHIESMERGEVFLHEDKVQKECKSIYPMEWETMIRTGVVESHLLQALIGAQYDVIINLMIKFGLLVVVLSREESNDLWAPINERQYIVPSLLHPRIPDDDVELQQNRPTSIEPNILRETFFIWFSLNKKITSRKKTLTVSQLSSEGYLPHGLFLRFLGKLLTWSQLITRGYDALSEQLYDNDVIICFGKRSFRIRALDEYNSISVTVTKKCNYAKLFQRLRGILNDVINECFGMLHFEVMLIHPIIGNETGAENGVFASSNYFYIPYDAVKEACREDSSIIISNNEIIDEVILKNNYSKWWDVHDTTQDCDVFLSYRWGEDDTRFVSLIYDALLDYDYNYVFHDDHIMEFGDNLQDTFAKALISAKVFVPFCSHDALARMREHNPQIVDNVLLEWILALECQKKGSMHIFPIPYGSINETTFFQDFNRQRISFLPNLPPLKTVEKAIGLLTLYQVSPSPEIYNLTVRDVVNNILGFKYSFNASEFKGIKECIPSCVQSIRIVHTARVDSCHFTTLASQISSKGTSLMSNFSRTESNFSTSQNSNIGASSNNESNLNVDEAWSILNDTNQLIDQENAANIKEYLAELGAYKSSDLIECEDQDIIDMANKLKKISKRKFLKALRK